MYDRILIPTDGSDHARRAARHGMGLAAAFDAAVDVVNVVDTERIAGPFDAGGVSEQYIERIEDERREFVAEIAALASDGTSVETDILRGPPADRLVEYATEHDVDLVTMGTRGTTGLERFLLGSVAEAVVRRSPVPVFATDANGAAEPVYDYDDVLVPTDGSETAGAAYDHALAVAEAMDARVHGVTVLDEELAPLGRAVGAHGREEHPQETPPGAAATDRLARQARERDLPATTAVREGQPGRALVEYADDHDVDLLAVGTHGRSGLDRAVLGSTTEWLLRHADQPVLTVSDGDATKE